MKGTKWGMTMLNIYKAGDELVYSDSYDERLSRWLCRYSDEPQEDLTSEADWMIDSHDLKAFLAQPDDAIVRSDRLSLPDPTLQDEYRISEIKEFVVYNDRAIALFKRDGNGKFFCNQMYTRGGGVPQSFWDAMYPDTYERAVAKVRDDFFSNEVPIWYFLGENSYDLYKVAPNGIIPCVDLYDEEGEDATCSEGTRDGLNSACFHEKDDTHWCAYFDLEALEGTGYMQKKLDTPEKLLLVADDCCSVEWLLRDGYSGVLTKEEYYCATRELRRQEYYRTHPEESIA